MSLKLKNYVCSIKKIIHFDINMVSPKLHKLFNKLSYWIENINFTLIFL